MEHESDVETRYNQHTWYSHQKNGTGTGGLGNKRMSGYYPNYSIVAIGQNIDVISSYGYKESKKKHSCKNKEHESR